MVGRKSQQNLTGRNLNQREKILCSEWPQYNRNDHIDRGIYYDNQFDDAQFDSLQRGKNSPPSRMRVRLQNNNCPISGVIRKSGKARELILF